MNKTSAGHPPGTLLAVPGRYIPRHYIRRIGRTLTMRAAVRHQALQTTALRRYRPVLSLPTSTPVVDVAGPTIANTSTGG